jgi:predicted MFS family arabinose efflux permease
VEIEPSSRQSLQASLAKLLSGWQIFITGLGIGQIISWGTLYYSFPLIAEHMANDLGFSKPEVYGAATAGLLIASFTAYPIGVAIDRGRGRAVMTLGSVLAGLLLLVWSQVTNLWMLYPLLAGIGLAQAMTLYEPAFAVVARRFGKDVRRGITALTLLGGFASTVFVPVIQFLLNQVEWRSTLVVLGLTNLLICGALYFVVINTQWDAPVHETLPRTSHDARDAEKLAVRWALGQRAFWGLLIAFTIYYATFSGLTYHLYPLLIERGFDTSRVVAAIVIMGPSQVAGRILIWSLAERASIRSIGKVVVLAFPIALGILLLLPPIFASLAVFVALYGAANGIFTIIRGVAVPDMLTRDSYGAINSLLAIPGTIAKAVAPLLVALLWAATSSYDMVLLVVLASSIAGVGGFWFAAIQTNKRKLPGESLYPSTAEFKRDS